MSELGRLLSEARAARKLTLADVEIATRIRQKYLDAFESGDYAALPRGATSRGFLRNYARYLGLDAIEAVRMYIVESGDSGPLLPPANADQSRPIDYRPLEVELMQDRRDSGWWRWAVAVVVVIILGALAVAFYSGRLAWELPDFRAIAALVLPQPPVASEATVTVTPTRWIVRVTPTPPLPPATAPVSARPAASAVGATALLPLPTPTVAPTSTPTLRASATPEAVEAGRISVLLRISQRSWLEVTADGNVVLRELLEAGQERTLEATQSLFLRTGNAGGVNLVVNGQEFGTMGQVGQVVDRTWVITEGQVQEVTATPPPPVTSGG